jgi:hypothetical protein
MSADEATPLDDPESTPVDDALQDWADRRLVETYRRLSHDLRQRGFDERTAHQMGCIEAELRVRGLDPDEIARSVEDAHR